MDADETVRLSPARAAMLGKLGAWSIHARGLTNTGPARAAFASRFVDEARRLAADRGEAITDAEAERRAAFLRKAHFTRLGLRSAAARRARRSPRVQTPAAETAGVDLIPGREARGRSRAP
jgi:hypothetical protein